ncbi:hypothetical protein HID58_039279 [Brassica napus]|uniref:Uncharacterized protein n=1 Tax=Brassica napus TaxID=3708 RepID=A0ABQ8BRL1_BRANA|nr:hypothetical protein HID58_039279 [Brassica napus]
MKLKLKCDSDATGEKCKQAASFRLRKGMSQYNPMSFVMSGTGVETLRRSMISGAGDAFSRRRWPPLTTLLLSTVISLSIAHFVPLLIRVRNRRKGLSTDLLPEISTSDSLLTASRRSWWVVSPKSNREDSLATAALRLSETSSGDLPSPQTCLDLEYVHVVGSAFQLLLEYRSVDGIHFPLMGFHYSYRSDLVTCTCVCALTLRPDWDSRSSTTISMPLTSCGGGCLSYCGEERALPPTYTQSKTFTVIVPFISQLELVLADPKNLLVLSVSHPSVALSWNLFVSTILKPRTLEVFVVSLDGLSLTRVGSSVNSPAPLSTIYANPAIDVGGTPLRRPDLFLISLRRQASSSDIPFPHSIIHAWPPPPLRQFKLGLKRSPEDPCHQPPQTYLLLQRFVNLASDVGGNPLRRPVLNHLFMKMASDVGGNPLRRPALSHQKLVRSVFRRTTLTSSSVVERTSLPCLPSMIGENLSVSFPSFSCSLLTGLLPCGAVRTGPEGAIETTSVFLVGEDCLSTSLVTISQLSDFVVEALSTHSNLVLNSLSTSYEDLSCLFLIVIVVHELSTRRCLILSWLCSICI